MKENNKIWSDRKHWMWFPWSFTRYALSEDRLFLSAGLLRTTFDETQLYRVIDVKMVRTLGHKLFGTGDIIITTRDASTPNIVFKNIKKPHDVKEMMVQMVEAARKRNMVREISGGFTPSYDYTDGDGDGIPDIFQ
ncbi:hypothetical protein ABB02_00948 [Clostridiaceae bacterium JG1575]|nr:hypothetical protein ABB02_00948 [Clostridiaceae bacterium JG1575]